MQEIKIKYKPIDMVANNPNEPIVIFNEKKKKELEDLLYSLSEDSVNNLKEILEKSGIDISKINIVDRSKYLIKHIPEVVEELLKKYGTEKILSKNEDIKKEALDLIQIKFHEELEKRKITSWSIYYILMYCKVPGIVELDENTKIFPFAGLSGNDYIEIMENLQKNFGPIASQLSEEYLQKSKETMRKKYSEKTPISILSINNITASSEKEVYDKTSNFANNVALCFSNIINSAVEIRGWLTVAQLEGFKSLYSMLNFPQYHLMYPNPKDIPSLAKNIINKMDENPIYKLILEFEKEAIYEEEEKFRLLKRWMILELVAEAFYNSSNDKDDNILTKEEKEQVKRFIVQKIGDKEEYKKNPKLNDRIENLIGQMNHKIIKEKVRDLLNKTGYNIEYYDSIKKDIIELIYQTRNCIVHTGKCCKEDKNIKCNCPKNIKDFNLDIKDYTLKLGEIILHLIGYFSGTEFRFLTESETPQDIKDKWNIDKDDFD